ncbi:hypothetical protein [Luteibacter aegosomatissinici]|uniref:hypothetical protein n=1 Tax=Luteibacter aegosomatissinici TaxID=2911539 RepID=UPI001FF92F45|nr:hypothetical protein [Luteibacter aegosomatissinici]UPG93523.1 hypothetical protein L2Y97_16995 [Luteibacter aegosomatissinici]
MTAEFVANLADRVGRLEVDVGHISRKVSTIEERISHIPTRADLWKTVAVAAGAVIGAMWFALQFFAKPYLDSLASQLIR